MSHLTDWAGDITTKAKVFAAAQTENESTTETQMDFCLVLSKLPGQQTDSRVCSWAGKLDMFA